jgi:hypothetical protein
VRGVNKFAESLKEQIESGQELADYDPHSHDIECLQRVLLAILNLDPLEESRHCANEKLKHFLTKLSYARGTNELAEL